MKKLNVFIILLFFTILIFIGCTSTPSLENQSGKEYALKDKKVAVVFDSAIPVLMQPKINAINNIIKRYEIKVVLIDMANKDYKNIKTMVDTSKLIGLVMCLPYNFEVERYLEDINTTDFNIIQFGGDYYSNDISVSVNNTYVGYLVGKKMGEIFLENGIISPKIGFYSSEWEWKKIEQGFSEGLREIVPEAYISSRQLFLIDGETTLVSGERDLKKLDGIGVFFCDTSLKLLTYSDDILLARVGTGEIYKESDNLVISLKIVDNKVSQEALKQFAEMLNGNQTTRSDFDYEAVFEFVVF